jgi:hypothetical protein
VSAGSNGGIVFGVTNQTTTYFDINADNALSGPGAQDYPFYFTVFA